MKTIYKLIFKAQTMINDFKRSQEHVIEQAKKEHEFELESEPASVFFYISQHDKHIARIYDRLDKLESTK